MGYPTLFDGQPKITKKLLADFEKRGLIVPEKSQHNVNPGKPNTRGGRQTSVVKNCKAGEVVGYNLLANKLRDGEISQEDARLLLCIEATRDGGPRETHVSRLVIMAFSTDKKGVLRKVEQWAKKVK